jgi:hypothetical protein
VAVIVYKPGHHATGATQPMLITLWFEASWRVVTGLLTGLACALSWHPSQRTMQTTLFLGITVAVGCALHQDDWMVGGVLAGLALSAVIRPLADAAVVRRAEFAARRFARRRRISCAPAPGGVQQLPEVTGLTTIWVRSARSAVVPGGSTHALTCGFAHRRTTANPLPTTGGQGVAGSSPFSPTVRDVRTSRTPGPMDRGFGRLSAPGAAGWAAGGPVVPLGIDGELVQEFACGGVDDADVQVLDEVNRTVSSGALVERAQRRSGLAVLVARWHQSLTCPALLPVSPPPTQAWRPGKARSPATATAVLDLG